MPFVVLSLRPIFCSVDISLSSLIPDINWCSHLFQYSRLLLCCLTCPFQAVTYSLRKNSFNSHEVFLQVFVVTLLTLVIVESRARGFRVLRYQRWKNGKLLKLCLLPATFSLTGTVRFFCCFFGRRLAVVPSTELAPMFEHLNKPFTISSWIFPERKPRELTATPCPDKDAIVSCILISELHEACYLAGISLLTPCWERGNTKKAGVTSI